MGECQEFRDALVVRYENSATFRRLLKQMNWSWGVGSMVVASGTVGIFYGVEDLGVVSALW
jgi:hypothetical protein